MRQYYSAGLKFKNVEPVPQAGFQLMPGTAFVAEARGLFSVSRDDGLGDADGGGGRLCVGALRHGVLTLLNTVITP